MEPSVKRFYRKFVPIADAIASLDLDQEDREMVAQAVADALDGVERQTDFHQHYDLFVLLASDPLVPCAGHHGQPCPHGRVIRQAMHNSSAPDGHSAIWAQRAPYGQIRCISCGAAEFIPAISVS
jgi:hypothetical protein